MLVVPRQSWPILFGENHLHFTQALVHHGDPVDLTLFLFASPLVIIDGCFTIRLAG